MNEDTEAESIHLRIPAPLLLRLTRVSEETGRSRSDVMRRLMEVGLKEHEALAESERKRLDR